MNTTHKLHIFDMDGTILDSMPMWSTIASDYLDSYDIPHDDDVNKLIEAYTLENAAKYFIELGLDKTIYDIIKDIYDFSFNKYKNENQGGKKVDSNVKNFMKPVRQLSFYRHHLYNVPWLPLNGLTSWNILINFFHVRILRQIRLFLKLL